MLEGNLGWPAASRTEGEGWRYRELVDDAFQRGAEGFWNDVIDELMERVDWMDRGFRKWLEDQKIKED